MINCCDLNGLSFDNFDNPTCIDLILTNRPSYFQRSKAFETGLSDFHLLTITEFKTSFQKREPKIIKYHDDKSLTTFFCCQSFCNQGILKYSSATLITLISELLKKLFLIYSINMHQLKKYVRANEAPFTTKEFHKAVKNV